MQYITQHGVVSITKLSLENIIESQYLAWWQNKRTQSIKSRNIAAPALETKEHGEELIKTM